MMLRKLFILGLISVLNVLIIAIISGCAICPSLRVEPTLVFEETFENLSQWDLVVFNSAGGSDSDPAPTIRNDMGNPVPSFDNRGNSWCGNAAFSKKRFNYSNGLVIEVDLWVRDARYEGCWVTGSFGIASELPGNGYYRGDGVYIDNDHCDPRYAVAIEYSAIGPLCWMDPEWQGHAWRKYFIITENGGLEMYTEPKGGAADNDLGSWHTYKIKIRPDRYVEFYKDGELVYTTCAKIALNYNNMPIVIGCRSHPSYGPVLHDNVKVYSLPPTY